VHLIADLAMLGVSLPDAFMQQGSLLTGVRVRNDIARTASRWRTPPSISMAWAATAC
jgi:hypothetical protein